MSPSDLDLHFHHSSLVASSSGLVLPQPPTAHCLCSHSESMTHYDCPSVFLINEGPSLAFLDSNDIWDTGATRPVSGYTGDFIGPMIIPSTPLLLGDIASGLVVEGIGTVKWSFYSDNGTLLTLHLKAFYVPTCKQRLLSPQKIFCPTENVRCTFVISSAHAQLLLDDSPILTVPYDPMNGLLTSQAILLPHHGVSSPKVNLCVT